MPRDAAPDPREPRDPDPAIPGVSDETDGQMIGRSRETPAVFAALFDRHHRTVHRYVSLRAGVAVGDDLMSETFLVAFEQRDRFDPDRGDARAWLLGIATVLLRKHARVEATAWRGMLASHLAAVLDDDAIDAAGARIDAAHDVRRMSRALTRLPAGDRDVLLLHAWADLDYRGIADALGIPIGTVRSRLNRARRKLRRVIEPGDARMQEEVGTWTS
jgi:RNA polymerase sigma factor (sigma-70 family)